MNKTLTAVLVAAASLLCISFPCRAQFYVDGCDPASVRWSYVDSDHYRIIYPRGLDSLARIYAYQLERVWSPVGGSIGYRPNQFYRKPMPVVLRTLTAEANGSVAWTPRRSQLYTVPDASSPDPIDKELSLVLHESRHIAQMQIGRDRPFRWLNYPVGELSTGALAGVYGGSVFFEGDAVLAETSLTSAGRGRSADFLEYWRACLSEGQRRSYWTWRWGSQRWYSPSHYTTGYVMLAGMSSLYQADFTKYYYDRIRRKHGWAWFNLQKSVKEVSGMKFKDAFAAVCDTLAADWSRDSLARGPHMPSSQLTPEPRFYKDYSGTAVLNGDIYSISKGIADLNWLVTIKPDGSEKRLSVFSGATSALRASDVTGELYWSEILSDSRWALKSTSVIMACNAEGKDRKIRGGGRLYNPYPSPTEAKLAVVDYPVDGGSSLAVLDARSGATEKYFQAPDGLQIVEPVWIDEGIFFAGLSAGGMGLYALDGFKCILSPGNTKIKDLHGGNGTIFFTSDRNGVDELYMFTLSDSSLTQVTSLGNGAGSFALLKDSLYYSVLKPEGRVICSTALSDLPMKKPVENGSHHWPFADALAAAEPEQIGPLQEVALSKPENYNKMANLFHVHSWAPVFVDFDELSSLSYETVTTKLNAGATAFFQNTLGTADGYLGVSLLDNSLAFRPGLHGRFTFRGLYPVISLSADFNDSEAISYTLKQEESKVSLKNELSGKPLISGGVKVYIPWKFNSGGLLRGVVPTISYTISNTTVEGKAYSRLSASVRGYLVSKTPASCLYPKWGVGLEVGTSLRPSLTEIFCPNIFMSAYAYLPGFWKTHGIRLAAVTDHLVKSGYFTEPYALTSPRGCVASGLSASLGAFSSQSRFSFDYAMPFAPVDWDFLDPVAHIRNFELRPFADFSLYASKTGSLYNLFSVGSSVAVVMSNLAWIPYTTRLGVSMAWNGGTMREYLSSNKNMTIKPFYIGMVFSIDI